MNREYTKPIVVNCPKCGFDNVFNQPYRYHAGFGNQGFLYNERGTRTLIWSSYDSDYERIVGKCHPWALSVEQKKQLEAVLKPDPNGGGRWLFKNPARCLQCGGHIADSIGTNVYYLVYDGSIDLDPSGKPGRRLQEMILVEPTAAASPSLDRQKVDGQ